MSKRRTAIPSALLGAVLLLDGFGQSVEPFPVPSKN